MDRYFYRRIFWIVVCCCIGAWSILKDYGQPDDYVVVIAVMSILAFILILSINNDSDPMWQALRAEYATDDVGDVIQQPAIGDLRELNASDPMLVGVRVGVRGVLITRPHLLPFLRTHVLIPWADLSLGLPKDFTFPDDQTDNIIGIKAKSLRNWFWLPWSEEFNAYSAEMIQAEGPEPTADQIRPLDGSALDTMIRLLRKYTTKKGEDDHWVLLLKELRDMGPDHPKFNAKASTGDIWKGLMDCALCNPAVPQPAEDFQMDAALFRGAAVQLGNYLLQFEVSNPWLIENEVRAWQSHSDE